MLLLGNYHWNSQDVFWRYRPECVKQAAEWSVWDLQIYVWSTDLFCVVAAVRAGESVDL